MGFWSGLFIGIGIVAALGLFVFVQFCRGMMRNWG